MAQGVLDLAAPGRKAHLGRAAARTQNNYNKANQTPALQSKSMTSAWQAGTVIKCSGIAASSSNPKQAQSNPIRHRRCLNKPNRTRTSPHEPKHVQARSSKANQIPANPSKPKQANASQCKPKQTKASPSMLKQTQSVTTET